MACEDELANEIAARINRDASQKTRDKLKTIYENSETEYQGYLTTWQVAKGELDACQAAPPQPEPEPEPLPP